MANDEGVFGMINRFIDLMNKLFSLASLILDPVHPHSLL